MEIVCCLLSAGAGIWLLVWLYESRRERKRAEDAERIAQAVAGPVPQLSTSELSTSDFPTSDFPASDFAASDFAASELAPWPVCESVRQARDWLAAVADIARAADRTGSPVRLAEIEMCLEDGWRITAVITGKIDALRHTRGESWSALPPQTQAFLRSDDERLRRLNDALASLRDDLTNAIAASGWGQVRHFDVIDDDLRAVGAALRLFPADPAQEA